MEMRLGGQILGYAYLAFKLIRCYFYYHLQRPSNTLRYCFSYTDSNRLQP
jgi:hypothetical protein